MSNDDKAAYLLPSDDRTVIKVFGECLQNPDGESILLTFDPKPDGSTVTNMQIVGGRNLAAVLCHYALEMNKADEVGAFIRDIKLIVSHAERQIRAEMRRRSAEN